MSDASGEQAVLFASILSGSQVMPAFQRSRCFPVRLIFFLIAVLSGCGKTLESVASGVVAGDFDGGKDLNDKDSQKSGCFRVTPDLSCDLQSEYFLRCVRGVYNVVFEGVAQIDNMVTSTCGDGNNKTVKDNHEKRRNLRAGDSSDRVIRGVLAHGRCTDLNQCHLQEAEHHRQLQKGDTNGDYSMSLSELPDPSSPAAPLNERQRRRSLVLSGGGDDEMTKGEMTIKALKVCLLYYFPFDVVDDYIRFERMPMPYCYNESSPELTSESEGGTFAHTTQDSLGV